MADVVQFRLERMANELDDLEQRGLIEIDKINEIVKQRREYEYRIQRPSPLKQDFLDYIDYEKKIEDYRKLRKRMIIRQMMEEEEREGGKKRKRKKKWKRSISDYAGIQRILGLYKMSVMRYKGDLGLWFQYLEFCKETKHGQMKEALAQALKLHSKVPGLWIYAATWEFDQNLNIVASRALMLSGLRASPNSEDIWIEYLRLELTYLNKLKARKEIVGEDLQTLERGSIEVSQWKEDNKDLFMSLNNENDEEKNDKESNVKDGHSEKQSIFFMLGSKLLKAIYHEATKAIPSSINLRKRFLEILSSIDLADSDKLRLDILEDLKRDFFHDELYWDIKARLHIHDIDTSYEEAKRDALSKLKQAFQVYEEALNVLPSAKMFSFFVKFWSDVTNPEGMTHKIGVEVKEFSLALKKAYEKAESTGCLIEDLACQYISFYLQEGNVEEGRQEAIKLCDGKLYENANLWFLRISIEIKGLANRTPISKVDLDNIFKLFEHVLNRFPLSKANGLWLMALKLFSCRKAYFIKLVKILEEALSRCSSDCGSSISAAVVDQTFHCDGIPHARVIYKRFLALPHPSSGLFKHCIELEKNLASIGGDNGLKNARQLYESALQIYREDKDLWKDYYAMEMKMGSSATANAVYCRARKELEDTTGLCLPS